MYYEEFGNKDEKILVLLHTSFNPYIYDYLIPTLKDDYHIYLPHLIGFGKEANKMFTFEENEKQLLDLISSFNKKVYLIGTSLGSQLAFRLLNKNKELFEKVILVSPFLLKDQLDLTSSINANMSLLNNLRNRFLVRIYARKNNIPENRRKDFYIESKNVLDETIANMVSDSPSISDYPDYKDVDVNTLLISFTSQHPQVGNTIDELLKINSYNKDIIVPGHMVDLLIKNPNKFKKIILDYFEEDKIEKEEINDASNTK